MGLPYKIAARIIRVAMALSVVFFSSRPFYAADEVAAPFHHTAWTSGSDLGAVFDVQQASDGYLWLTTSTGVFRFDGVRFQTATEVTNGAVHNEDLESVFVTHSGDPWFATRSQGSLLWRNGKLQVSPDRHCTPNVKTDAVVEDLDGSLWIRGSAGLFRLRNNACEQFGDKQGYPNRVPTALFVDRSGTLWVQAPSGLVYTLRRGASKFESVPGESATAPGATCFRQAPDGSIWISNNRGLRQITYTGAVSSPAIKPESTVHSSSFLGNFTFSPDGTLWAVNADGIVHFEHPDDATGNRKASQVFTPQQGLSSNVVWKLLFDHEGNLWIATNSGLDRLRRNAFNSLPYTPPHEHQLGVALGEAGSIWTGGRNVPLTRINADGTTKVFPQVPDILALRSDLHGVVWAAGSGDARLWQIDGDTLHPIHYPDETSMSPMAIAVGKSGRLWVSTVGPGIFRRTGDTWTNENIVIGRKPGVLGTMRADDAGNVWFAFSNKLVEWDGSQYHYFGYPDGPLNISVMSLAFRNDHVWLAGSGGVVLFHLGKFRRILWKNEGLPGRVSSLAETDSGDLWMNGFSGVTHIPAAELKQWLLDPSHPVSAEQFDADDGLPGLAAERLPEPSLVESPDGRLWFATTRGIAWLDPASLSRYRNLLPPPTYINSLTASGKVYSATAALHLPANSHNLEIDYTALSLTRPERVLFKYKLDGIDQDWQNAGTRRQAFYTNLPPRHYVFHVIACNNDGVWNTTGATLAFTIQPAYYQTWWFLCLCTLAILFILWIILVLRMRHLSTNLRLLAEERAGERMRIARDLHDTLLQGVHGLVLTFHVIADRMSPDNEARHMMKAALANAECIINEGRDRVSSLREGAILGEELIELLEHTGADLNLDRRINFKVQREGASSTLQPQIADEIFNIAREAITNAFRHAEAYEINLVLDYGNLFFTMTCSDNGRGFNVEDELNSNATRHWGIRGMAERAKKIGGHFLCRSEQGKGTEVRLQLPSYLAYRNTSRLRYILGRIIRRSS